MIRTTVLTLAAAVACAPLAAQPPSPDELWRFYDGGAAWLLPAAERERLAAAGAGERERFARDFLARDPELARAVESRRRQVLEADLSFYDERARLLFLHGAPDERLQVDCASTFKPIEIWHWGAGEGGRRVLLVRPSVGSHFLAWRPTSSKRALYVPEMEYLLEQFEELRGRIRGRRPDRQLCRDHAERIDRLTGVDGMFEFQAGRLTDAQVESHFAPPADLTAWVKAALAAAPAAAARLPEPEVQFAFPEQRGQRLLTRFLFTLPAGTALGVVDEKSGRESRLAVTGTLLFESLGSLTGGAGRAAGVSLAAFLAAAA